MRLTSSLVSTVVLSIFLAGCTSKSEQSNTVSSAPIEIPAANAANTGGLIPYTPTNGTISNANVTVVNANPANNSAMKMKPLTFPAPDDSEYFSVMDKTGMAVETRLFHNNPQIIKVTRTWKTPTDKTIQIYLKNGKVVKLPGDQIQNVNSAPVSVFLDAAGIKASPPLAQPQGNTAVKEPEKIKPTKAPN
jgi:hypothetical protein